jgi:hypothetical protein
VAPDQVTKDRDKEPEPNHEGKDRKDIHQEVGKAETSFEKHRDSPCAPRTVGQLDRAHALQAPLDVIGAIFCEDIVTVELALGPTLCHAANCYRRRRPGPRLRVSRFTANASGNDEVLLVHGSAGGEHHDTLARPGASGGGFRQV